MVEPNHTSVYDGETSCLWRIEYWSNVSTKHPVGTQFKWADTGTEALALSLDHMGEVCFPRGQGHDYDWVNVTPNGWEYDAD